MDTMLLKHVSLVYIQALRISGFSFPGILCAGIFLVLFNHNFPLDLNILKLNIFKRRKYS